MALLLIKEESVFAAPVTVHGDRLLRPYRRRPGSRCSSERVREGHDGLRAGGVPYGAQAPLVAQSEPAVKHHREPSVVFEATVRSASDIYVPPCRVDLS